MDLLGTLARYRLGAAVILGFGIVVACSSPGSTEKTDLPQCSGTQRCVGYPSPGDWVCMDSCSGADAGDCPSGMTCKSVSGCCTGTACSAVTANVCVASDAGAGGDGGPDAPNDASGGDADGSFPQCSATQRCVGYPSFGDRACLESCGGDAGDCPSGMTCESVTGCCAGTGCAAPIFQVCVASDAGASGDAATDAPSDASKGTADGGLPQCTTGQRCVGYPSFGDWVCLDSCSGADAGDCPSGTTCKSESGCCTGTACDPVIVYVCVAP
jgi:hypothetical protein